MGWCWCVCVCAKSSWKSTTPFSTEEILQWRMALVDTCAMMVLNKTRKFHLSPSCRIHRRNGLTKLFVRMANAACGIVCGLPLATFPRSWVDVYGIACQRLVCGENNTYNCMTKCGKSAAGSDFLVEFSFFFFCFLFISCFLRPLFRISAKTNTHLVLPQLNFVARTELKIETFTDPRWVRNRDEWSSEKKRNPWNNYCRSVCLQLNERKIFVF